MRILVAEDHPALGPNLKKGLERHRYAVDLVTTEDNALLYSSKSLANSRLLGSEGNDYPLRMHD